MTGPEEIEIKLAASPALLDQLRAHPALAGDEHSDSLVTTYYDTPGARLQRGGAALRLRESSTGRQQTLKLATPGVAAVKRGEWNEAASGDLPDPAGFPARPRAALARLLNGLALEPIATVRIERTTRRLHSGRSAIEIAFDSGTITGGGGAEAVHELEIELVHGHLADLLALALRLPLGPQLRWSVRSKAERCNALAYGLAPAAVRAHPARLTPGMDAASGFQAIAWNCLSQLLANYSQVIATGDAEALHQCRVAIRRLRAAFSLFRDVLDDAEAPLLRAEFKAAAGALGPARDLHVLIGRVRAAAKAGDADADELLAHLGARLDDATREARTLLSGAPFQRLLFQFALWVESGKWLKRKGKTGGDQPLRAFAARALSRRRRKLRDLDEPLPDMTDAARHRLRIEAKKLRYAAEFFAPLLRGRERTSQRRAFAKALEQLQDSLGQLNDMIVAVRARKALFAGLEPIAAARLATQLDELLADQPDARRKLLRVAERSLARAAGAPAWWKGD